MNNYLDDLINKTLPQFDVWIQSIDEYLKNRYSESEISSDHMFVVTRKCVHSFMNIAKTCISYGRFKDNWELNKYFILLYGPELVITSLKTKTEYKIGLDEKGIYLSTDLRFNENLKYMSDTFWKLVLSLMEYQGFEYEEYEFVSNEIIKNHPKLFDTHKGVIFRILRKYFFDTISSEHNGSVGELRITWPIGSNFEEIVKNCCTAFKIMYRLNYDLWKISDLRNKKT